MSFRVPITVVVCLFTFVAHACWAARTQLPLSGEWRFQKSDQPGFEQTDLDDSGWQTVTVPHTWNAIDGQDGGNNYFKGVCWYRRHFEVTPAMGGQALVIRFEAVNRRAEVFVNGQAVGHHVGGFAAFAFDITRAIKPGDNVLAVRVSSIIDRESPPYTADFTFFGGIYRPVELIALPQLHIAMTDHASPGVTIHTPRVSDESADVTVTTRLENAGAPRDAKVRVEIRDAADQVVASAETSSTGGGDQPVDTNLAITNPHRWNGRKDPYLYRVNITLSDATGVVDQVSQPLGIRTFSVDEKRGFILNGDPYNLHGVNRHQDRLDKGWAISDDDIREDMSLMREIGCTALRLSHYQQADLMYTLADQMGMIVWAEVPVVDHVENPPAFEENCRQQLTELIRQNENHPSICFWSVSNEVEQRGGRRGGVTSNNTWPSTRPGIDPSPVLKRMSDLAKQEDPSRLTTAAWRPRYIRPGVTDVYGQNPYFGWYDGTIADFEPWLLKQPGRLSLSEYGAGASIYFHSEHPIKVDHTEEYQCLLHEAHWAVIKRHPELWGTFIWSMFDFAVDSRKEGDHAGRNDKGLVTYDRKTRKDAFYFYQANWSDELMLHLNSKRFTVRGSSTIAVKAYSNASQVELRVNGAPLGAQVATPGSNGIFLWPSVPLREGENRVEVSANRDGVALHDECQWTYKPGAPTETYAAQDDVMRADLLRHLPGRPAKSASGAATQAAE